jgi:hypothetical protein
MSCCSHKFVPGTDLFVGYTDADAVLLLWPTFVSDIHTHIRPRATCHCGGGDAHARTQSQERKRAFHICVALLCIPRAFHFVCATLDMAADENIGARGTNA